MRKDIELNLEAKGIAVLVLVLGLFLVMACQMPQPAKDELTIPYLFRGTWENDDGTATIVATEHNLILSYGYVPGANMNLEQLLNEAEGMYTLSSTNTMLTIHSETMGITLYEFIVNGDRMTCRMNGTETIVLHRQ